MIQAKLVPTRQREQAAENETLERSRSTFSRPFIPVNVHSLWHQLLDLACPLRRWTENETDKALPEQALNYFSKQIILGEQLRDRQMKCLDVCRRPVACFIHLGLAQV